MIFTDGPIAAVEMKRVLAQIRRSNLKVIEIARNAGDAKSGIAEAGNRLKAAIPSLASATITGRMADIPRSHLPWRARTWEGTSGDLVVDALGKYRGGVRALVTPTWVAQQNVQPSLRVTTSVKRLKKQIEDAGVRIETETIESFVRRQGEERISWRYRRAGNQ